MYVSEFTQFINQLTQEKPYLEAERIRGRAIYWDKEPLTPDVRAKLKESTVAQQPYVYQIKG